MYILKADAQQSLKIKNGQSFSVDKDKSCKETQNQLCSILFVFKK